LDVSRTGQWCDRLAHGRRSRRASSLGPTLASSVFVRPQTMPGWLQAFVHVNPISHLVAAERGLMGGHPAAGQIAWVLLASALMVAVFAPATVRLYARRP
jgi:ABC-2 type transport system permease protein